MAERAASVLRDFLANEALGGVLLIAAAALAMVAANSPFASDYFHLLHVETGPVIAPAIGPMTVHLWVNDGLMALFFLLVGLEIKRELIDGELARPDRRRLPIVAAAAGMICPAIVYLAITAGAADLRSGWAIPAATDIAFAIGVLALLGPRVPASLKLFLTTVAIVDDMGAVAIIAVFYSHGLVLFALAGAAIVAVAMVAMNRLGVVRLWPYLLGFVLLWLLVLMSGVHATIAGVVAAMLIPVRRDHRVSPLHRLEHALNPWVAYGVMPLFGFANAGVALTGLSPAIMVEPLVLGIALALFFGKQIGIYGSIRIAVRLGFARAPGGASWTQIYGVALLAGIGFTMSLFIGGLAFPGNAAVMDAVKIGVLAGSILSALTGFLVLRFAAPRKED
uniref:Na+/H+ antiporter NhaA n=1 Tax=Sphingomonas bacterium TaxID=1895847 RepID=UPI00262B0FCD|nr:Na+/H+ antiporter NhaA [Sphingomonas bacterium]